MQTDDAIMLHQTTRYLDPTTICETIHVGPSKWKDDDGMIAGCETPKEKNEKQISYHKDAMKRVAVYIGVRMEKWQDEADTIYAPIPHRVSLISIFCDNIHLLRSMANSNRI
jgi:hypothetical protein